MSLLIDALRKAEKDREQTAVTRDDLEGLALEPLASIPEAPQTLPPEAFSQHEAAARLFEVKQDDGPQGPLVWLAVAGVVAGLCLGAYVWWQMQPTSTVLMPPGMVAEHAPPPLTSDARTSTPRRETTAPVPSDTPSMPIRPDAPDVAAARPETTFKPPTPESAQRGDLGRQSTLPAPAASPPAPAVRLAPTHSSPLQVPAMLSAAYQAYSAGELAKARTLYTDYLRRDPNNVDALNGLGAIAMQEGRAADAIQWFRKTLIAKPGDPVAETGLASLAPDADPVEEESRLREQSDAAPDSPSTRFALGNALAQQGRWSEAQAAYFDAHVGDPDNPDYLFNLAVSLDQLAQPAIARQYYRRALDAATLRPPAFDPAAVRARLAELDGPAQ